MCGLCGAISAKPLTSKKRLQRARIVEGLLVANASRGTDATGLAAVSEERIIYKRATDSFAFVDDPKARKVARHESLILIGHCRFATHGSNTDENAHPFAEGHILGSHNGIISNYAELDRIRRESMKIESSDYAYAPVDSQVVFRLLDDGTIEEYLPTIERLRGSAALVWHDDRAANQVWMMAHDNPLNLAWVPNLDTIFWSSQYDHLASVLQATVGSEWASVTLKDDRLYRFWSDDLLNPASWKTNMRSYATTYQTTYNDVYGQQWHDPGWDDLVEVDYPQVKVHTKKGSGPKGTRLATETEVAIIERMGIPWRELHPVAPIADDSLDEVEALDGDFRELTPDTICEVCQDVIDDESPHYQPQTRSWVCGPCWDFWTEEMGEDRLLPVVV